MLLLFQSRAVRLTSRHFFSVAKVFVFTEHFVKKIPKPFLTLLFLPFKEKSSLACWLTSIPGLENRKLGQGVVSLVWSYDQIENYEWFKHVIQSQISVSFHFFESDFYFAANCRELCSWPTFGLASILIIYLNGSVQALGISFEDNVGFSPYKILEKKFFVFVAQLLLSIIILGKTRP